MNYMGTFNMIYLVPALPTDLDASFALCVVLVCIAIIALALYATAEDDE